MTLNWPGKMGLKRYGLRASDISKFENNSQTVIDFVKAEQII